MDHPFTVFHFQVEWGGTRLGFTEVTGLNVQVNTIQYREGNSPDYSARVMPGIPVNSNVILKRGIMRGDNEYFNWLSTIQLNKVERRDVTISLLDEQHEPVVIWKLRNAWPVRLDAPTLNSSANEVAIETLEIAHEGVVIENG